VTTLKRSCCILRAQVDLQNLGQTDHGFMRAPILPQWPPVPRSPMVTRPAGIGNGRHSGVGIDLLDVAVSRQSDSQSSNTNAPPIHCSGGPAPTDRLGHQGRTALRRHQRGEDAALRIDCNWQGALMHASGEDCLVSQCDSVVKGSMERHRGDRNLRHHSAFGGRGCRDSDRRRTDSVGCAE
jgi:hypothetical protein